MKKKTHKTTLSFRAPIELEDQLAFITENTGISKTDLLLEGLKVSLKNHSTIKILEAKRDDLTKKIELLKKG